MNKKEYTREEIDKIILEVESWLKRVKKKRKEQDDFDVYLATYPRFPKDSSPPKSP